MQNLGILIGRFQPLHSGHRDLIRQAAKQCKYLVILVGSANRCRSIKNPFTYAERAKEIDKFLFHEKLINVSMVPLNDYPYSDSQWINDINIIAEEKRDAVKASNVTLFGFQKEGNNYLKWFPQYNFVNITTPYAICSTDIRKLWFEAAQYNFDPSVVADWKYFEKEKELFSGYPFPETLNFNCADAILECCGHILLIQRGAAPGKDTWALPGGFKNANETFIDCAIRELMEETNVRVPEKVLRGSIVSSRLFDSPSRGSGIPRNTLAVHIKISANADGSLPRANGADDAIDSKWVKITDIMNTMSMYDDHSSIISAMCGVLPLPAHVNPRFNK